MRDLPAPPSFRPPSGHRFVLALLPVFCFVATMNAVMDSAGSELRNTAIVRLVKKARPSVVNIHGQKTVSGQRDEFGRMESSRRVNGMGTGVVIDERGYIITNHHVVDGVRRILVTMADGTEHVARLVSREPVTDLAIIKIDIDEKLPVITIGTSRDLNEGEPAIAIGNAYGYEHTVTEGIISSLHRTVLVSDTQKYEDQIQTSASINPGNSGGPLMNIDGEMIGINVAVRAGAQSIAFAIPVDKAMEVAADLMSIERIDHRWHGVILKKSGDSVIVDRVIADSPAEQGGLEPGDEITVVGDLALDRALDLERALLDRETGEEVEVTVRRGEDPVQLSLVLASTPSRSPSSNPVNSVAWEVMGLKLRPISLSQFRQRDTHYNGGIAITAVRPGSPAARQGIRRGDILVGVHRWETISMENISYILTVAELPEDDSVKFWILRGKQVLQGDLRLATRPSRETTE